MLNRTLGVLFLLLFSFHLNAQTTKRAPVPEDYYRLQLVQDPQVSPDGAWIAYTLTTVDKEADKRNTSLWMVNWEGTQDLQLTTGPEPASSPQWSPDGKFLAFLAARGTDAHTQVWLLDRRGGEAHALTSGKGDVDSFSWSPDGKRLLLEMEDGDEAQMDAKKPKPIVLNRYHFKQDVRGYLNSTAVSRLYLFDIATRKAELLTSDKGFDEHDAAWSADGTQVAYLSKHGAEPDRSSKEEIYVVEARAGSTPRLLTTLIGGGQHLLWSPDGRTLAFLQGFEDTWNAYSQERLAVIPVAGGTARVLTAEFDRGVSGVEFTADGSALTFLANDDRYQYLAKVPVAGGKVERIGRSAVYLEEKNSSGGHTAFIAATDTSAQEVYVQDANGPRKLTSHNDALIAEWQLGAVEDISFPSKDGTEVHGLMIKPPGYEPGRKYPTLLWIHGGPNMQDGHALEFGLYPLQLERQFYATRGYVVLAINYRGSSGRGAAYTGAIFADWGHKEVEDLLAGLDYAVQKGIADPARIGTGGWSYGGILTDYLIASDPRFKVAISGAGSANQLSMYGSDQYVVQYDNELLPPWKAPDAWMKVSYPFFHADRIHTPTLFVGGQNDFNVPIIGGEQMYQALRSMGVPTQMVIYPGEFHLFRRPSFMRDRMERYLAWYEKYLKAQP